REARLLDHRQPRSGALSSGQAHGFHRPLGRSPLRRARGRARLVNGQQELTEFLQRLATEGRLRPHRVPAYRHDVTALLDCCARETVASFADIDSYVVRRFAAESHRRGLSARSVARRLSAVRTFLAYLGETGELRANRAVHV